MKKLLFTLVGIIVFLAAVASVVSAHDEKQVTICHADNGNGYITKTADEHGNIDGHDNHHDDIIPPFDYDCGNGQQNNTCHYSGKNWDKSNQLIWQNNCQMLPITVTTTPSIVPTTTPTPVFTPTPTPDCDGDSDGDNPNSDDDCTIVATATPTPEEDNDCLLPGQPDLDNSTDDSICVTPTPSYTPTPTLAEPTVTPTPNNNNNNNNNNSNNSSSNNSGASSNNSSSTPQQTVLAASTMADTGSFQDTTMNITLLGGMLSLGLGIFSYGKEKKA